MITTKNGDKGVTDYFGKRLVKDAAEIELLGDLDELQAVAQLAGLDEIGRDLYKLMGKLDMSERIGEIEAEIEKLTRLIKPESKFVLFGTEQGRRINWVRTVVRRAERRAVRAGVDGARLVYLNRLSDYCYLLALKEEKS